MSKKNKIMDIHAEALSRFLTEMKSSFIFTDMTEDEFKHHEKVIKKTIKKLRKHDDSVYENPDNIDPDGLASMYANGD